MKKNLSLEIHDYLLSEIRANRIPPGDMLPSENTLCSQFHVSRPTVRKAIARLIVGNYVSSKPGLGTFVNSCQSEPTATSRERILFGIDGVDLYDEYQYFSPISHGAQKAADSIGSILCLTDLHKLLAGNHNKVDAFIASRVDCNDFEHARQLQQSGVPVVLLNRYPRQKDLSYISVDFMRESFLLVNRLLRNGARNIALVGRQTSENITRAGRSRGWEEAYRANGLPVPFHLAVDFQDFAPNSNVLPDFFREHAVDVVFVTTGYHLPPVLTSLERVGKRVPEDLDIVCFEDVERLCEAVDTPISYVKMPLAAMGRMAVEYLARRLANPQLEPVNATLNASVVVNRCKYLL